MKTPLLLLFVVAGFLTAARPALAQEPSRTPWPPAAAATPLGSGNPRVEFRTWAQGEAPIKLIRQDEGFCALTSVTGHFEGGGEQVRVYLDADGYWYLGGKSAQQSVSAQCIIVHFREAPAAPEVRVLAASYSFGSDYADVTQRVSELVSQGVVFQANPQWLRVDPHPYWNKGLVIFCEVRGKKAMLSVGEGENVSLDILLQKARPVADENTPLSGSTPAHL